MSAWTEVTRPNSSWSTISSGHVDDDAAAVLRAIVPGRAAGALPVALEDPVPELPADGQDPPSSLSTSRLSSSSPGRKSLLHDPVLDALLVGEAGALRAPSRPVAVGFSV